MKRYKGIFLDWDDTIGDFSGAAHRSLEEIFGKYHLADCYGEFDLYYRTYQQHNTWLWEQYGIGKVTKDYLEFDRFFFPLMMAPKPFAPERCMQLAPQLAQDHLRHTTEYFSLLPDSAEVVRYLAARYPLTIVSNGFAEVQYTKIEASGLRDCFRHVVLSEEVGCQKPQPRIYEIALERNGLRAEEVLMIGDSWTSDIQGAIGAGIDQLWIQHPWMTQDPTLPATYKTGTFREVMTML